MADNKKVYQIEINGIKESVNAVESLNRVLNELDKRMKELEKSNVKLNVSSTVGSSSGGSTRASNKSSLSEEEKILKQIEEIDAKREAYSKEIYQNYLAAKDVLDETVKDQKQIAASERLQSNNYTNTMQGLKQRLKDIQTVRQTTDMASDEFKKLTTEANSLTEKLKELEAETGSYGRNVGNYASAFDKIKVAVGNTTREYANYRQAIKELKQERFALADSLGRESQQYKEIDEAVKQLESDYNDLNKSSQFMDNLLDAMESFTAMASVSKGLSAIFGIDNDAIERSIQKLVALQNVLKGIETINLQMQKREGIGKWLQKGNKAIDNFVSKITGAQVGVNGLSMASKGATIAVRGLSLALKGIGIGLAIAAVNILLDNISKIGDAMDIATKKTNALEEALNVVTSRYKTRMDELSTSYMKGSMSNENYLTNQYQLQTNYIADQIKYLKERSSILKNDANIFETIGKKLSLEDTVGGDFSGQRMTEPTTVGTGNWLSFDSEDFSIYVKNIEEVEKAWRQCNEAIYEGKDYFDKWGSGLSDWFSSIIVSVGDTDRVMRGLGRIRLSDFIGDFEEVNTKFKENKISAEQFAKEIARLKKELNSNDVLQSVIVNLDKYIDDEKVRETINSIIDELKRLDDAFNMTSAQQVHHWEQVRIDAMADGSAKIKAQIANDEKYEIAQYGKTQEQINLIHAKYQKKLQEELKKYNKSHLDEVKQQKEKLQNAQNDLAKTNIAIMKEGWEKQLAELKQEQKEKIQAIERDGILVGERTTAINALYDKKIKEAKKNWSAEIKKIYEDLIRDIIQMNKQIESTNLNTQTTNVTTQKTSDVQTTATQSITPSNFDDSKALEAYYKKRLEIEKNAAQELARINAEKLANELEYAKEEEKLRHQRLVSAENGEYVKQLEQGKITQEQYNNLIEAENKAHYDKMNALDDQYAAQLKQSQQQALQEVQNLYSSYYANILTDIQKDKAEIDEVMSKQPKVDTKGWGVVQALSVKQTYRDVIKQYEDLKKNVVDKQRELERELKAGHISPEDFAMHQSELKKEVKAIDEAVTQVKQKQQMLVADFMQSIMKYVEAAMSSFNTIMNAIWDAEDVAFDKEQEEIDKANEELATKLQEQEDLIEGHKSKIDSLEDELATSRGDRRQQLIDQINAEMAAERAAVKQKQKIQKQQEQQQKKQDKLEEKRKKAQYKRDMLQAVVNGAMAVTMAAVNAWPVPAIPMMALAAATTAAQIAIMASNKPYAKGGQLEGGLAVGNRHRDGGIKVLGGRAEIEGGEYITNRLTTSKNIDLLDYINSSHKKLNIDDFIDFYSANGRVRRNVNSITPKRVFADGGVVPTLTNDYDISDRLVEAFESYNNRPVVVSVVDINNRQAAVRNVQVLAGLDV